MRGGRGGGGREGNDGRCIEEEDEVMKLWPGIGIRSVSLFESGVGCLAMAGRRDEIGGESRFSFGSIGLHQRGR